jgi:hypothetical protein
MSKTFREPENNTFVGRILIPDFPAGYAQYTLYRNGVGSRFKAHKLVAATFIGPCPLKEKKLIILME